MISDSLVTSYNIGTDTIKTFIFNRKMDNPEKEAKKFCRQNHMKYLGCKTAEPYSIHTWQHYEQITFDAECTRRTPRFYYEYGKL